MGRPGFPRAAIKWKASLESFNHEASRVLNKGKHKMIEVGKSSKAPIDYHKSLKEVLVGKVVPRSNVDSKMVNQIFLGRTIF